jgi:hypothetical protein
MMLNESRAHALRYDEATDEARIDVADAGGAPAGSPRTISGQLLLDANGFLVGVDLGGEGLARAVVMLGRHEDVASAEPAGLVVRGDASGATVEVRIKGAKAAIRAGEKNPYL